MMKIYAVGGAVRDKLLGLPIEDRDYVVVGASEAMMQLQGYRRVGRDFPVFLHPTTHAEYALARTEKKVAPGYRGFVCDTQSTVTLEEDLARRDLTINAMAEDEDGSIIDPFDGQRDLSKRLLRHTTLAFTEDPIRILRVARFAARLNFSVHPTTLKLMQNMVASSELDALVPERVWQELSKGLMTSYPLQLFYVLDQCGALGKILPELVKRYGVLSRRTPPYPLRALRYAAQHNLSLAQRFAILMQWLELPLATWETQFLALAHRLKVPKLCQKMAMNTAHMMYLMQNPDPIDLKVLLRFFHAIRAFQSRSSLEPLLVIGNIVWRFAAPSIRPNLPVNKTYFLKLQRFLQAAQSVDATAIAQRYFVDNQIAQALDSARLSAMRFIQEDRLS